MLKPVTKDNNATTNFAKIAIIDMFHVVFISFSSITYKSAIVNIMHLFKCAITIKIINDIIPYAVLPR